jgi:methionyl-tRNA formyltransferase
MLKIILVGYGELAAALLSGILSTDNQIQGLLSWNRRKKMSRITYHLFPDELEKLRRKNNVKAIDVQNINSYEFVRIATDLKPDIIMVGSWGQILKKHIIEIPSKYCINCHPSYLPYHRGSNPYASAIVYGESFTGVTFHEINEEIDAGNIILQEKIPIEIDDTGNTLRYKCAEVAKKLVIRLLEDIQNNRAIPIPQDHSKATYYPRLKASDGAIDWYQSVEAIHNKIRGLSPWVFAFALYQNKVILIKKSQMIDKNTDKKEPGTILEVREDGIIVSTTDTTKALLLSEIEIFGLNLFFSKVYLKKHFKPGQKLTNAL